MTPFQEFRHWARRAPSGERAVTAIAAVLAVALLGWLLVPEGDDSTEIATGGDGFSEGVGDDVTATTTGDASTGGGGGGSSSVGGGSPSGGGGGGGSVGGGSSPGGGSTGGGGSTPGATGCVSPPGTAKGITAKEVRIAVALTEIVGPAANSIFGIDPPEKQRQNFEAVIAGINREGGVACRKLVAQYYEVNPVDESQMRRVCLDVAAADVFAMADTGSIATRPAALACFGQQKIPYFGAFYITETLRKQYYPYIFSFYTKEMLYKDTAYALRERGFFDAGKGFRKLGFLYRDCEPPSIASYRTALRQVGVSDSEIVPYNVGCPAVFATPSDLTQAVLTFQQAGVTHVTIANETGDIATFTDIAEQQGFRPKYGLPDEAIMSVASGNQAPNPDNIANALIVTHARDGEEQTPGMTPTAGTKRCDAYYRAKQLESTWKQPALAGNACNQLWMLKEALSRAPEISPPGLVAGLQRAKSIDFSFPQAPNDFTGRGVTMGGQFWRVTQFKPSCDCWQVIQKEFRRGF